MTKDLSARIGVREQQNPSQNNPQPCMCVTNFLLWEGKKILKRLLGILSSDKE